jgi:hypothetical protein
MDVDLVLSRISECSGHEFFLFIQIPDFSTLISTLFPISDLIENSNDVISWVLDSGGRVKKVFQVGDDVLRSQPILLLNQIYHILWLLLLLFFLIAWRFLKNTFVYWRGGQSALLLDGGAWSLLPN